jgi:riboflavin biosynthesis pyrimidine reductase
LIQESVDDISAKMKEFQNQGRRRPFVTLAYAQSIDGKIAIVANSNNNSTKTSSNFAISGPESLRLTHALRSIHDAILVGGNTLSVDNPRLNNRLWPPETFVPRKQPRAVVLDTHLRHLRLLGTSMRVHDPIVCCSVAAYQQAQNSPFPSATLLPCETRVVPTNDSSDDDKEILDLQDAVSKLHRDFGIESLMIEGGASVLSQFVGETLESEEGGNDDVQECKSNKALFDCLCVTISPKLLGVKGLDSMPFASSSPRAGSKSGDILGPLHCISLGDDCVLFADRKK